MPGGCPFPRTGTWYHNTIKSFALAKPMGQALSHRAHKSQLKGFGCGQGQSRALLPGLGSPNWLPPAPIPGVRLPLQGEPACSPTLRGLSRWKGRALDSRSRLKPHHCLPSLLLLSILGFQPISLRLSGASRDAVFSIPPFLVLPPPPAQLPPAHISIISLTTTLWQS